MDNTISYALNENLELFHANASSSFEEWTCAHCNGILAIRETKGQDSTFVHAPGAECDRIKCQPFVARMVVAQTLEKWFARRTHRPLIHFLCVDCKELCEPIPCSKISKIEWMDGTCIETDTCTIHLSGPTPDEVEEYANRSPRATAWIALDPSSVLDDPSLWVVVGSSGKVSAECPDCFRTTLAKRSLVRESWVKMQDRVDALTRSLAGVERELAEKRELLHEARIAMELVRQWMDTDGAHAALLLSMDSDAKRQEHAIYRDAIARQVDVKRHLLDEIHKLQQELRVIQETRAKAIA